MDGVSVCAGAHACFCFFVCVYMYYNNYLYIGVCVIHAFVCRSSMGIIIMHKHTCRCKSMGKFVMGNLVSVSTDICTCYVVCFYV